MPKFVNGIYKGMKIYTNKEFQVSGSSINNKQIIYIYLKTIDNKQ